MRKKKENKKELFYTRRIIFNGNQVMKFSLDRC